MSLCYGQQIARNPYKELYRSESGVTLMQRTNISDETRISMEKQLEKATSDSERDMIKKSYSKSFEADKKMENDGMFFIYVPEKDLEEYNSISLMATKDKMKALLKVLSTGDFNNGDSVSERGVTFRYHGNGSFTVGKTRGGVLEVGFANRDDFIRMYEIMEKIE